MTSLRLIALALPLWVGVACHKKPKPPERTAPWLASARGSASASPPLQRMTYRLTSSRIEFELPARRATPKGKFGGAEGELDVDLDDLSHTTGHVGLDLATIEMLGSEGLVDGPNTARALDWLELGAGVAPAKRDVWRKVTFELTSLDAGRKVQGSMDDRRVRRRELVTSWVVRGELGLHGVRAAESADVTLTLVPGPDPLGPPAELLIRSRRPLVVDLGTHDIVPREGHGVAISKDQAVLGESVGREVRVNFDLRFAPRG